MPGGRVPDPLHRGCIHPHVDEALDATISGDDAESTVGCIDQPHRRLDDPAEHDLEIQALDDGGVRVEQISEPALCECCVGGLIGPP